MTGCVLIVEDDPIIAWDLESLAEEVGASVRSCWSIHEALQHLEDDFVGALLDIDVLDGKTFPVARRLQERQVPVAFISGSRAIDLPPEFLGTPFISKPFQAPDVVRALRLMVA